MKRMIPALVASALLAAPLAASAAPNARDVAFARAAAQGGMAEVTEATLAQQNGSSAAVKEFARRMLADHGKANAQLAEIATAEGIALPTDAGPTNAQAKGSLEGLRGTTFDAAYLEMQHQAHVKTASLFQAEIAGGSDPKLVAFARATLPTVNAHSALVTRDLVAIGKTTAPAPISTKM